METTAPIDIYARVSRLKDKDQTTTASQVAVCRAELEERGLPAGHIHIDDGKSAWDPKVYRKDWEKLMARLESGEAGGVIVYDLERFARQVRDGERLVTAAERGILVIDSEGSYDLRKPGDKKNFRNAIVAAEYYSDLLRVKVKRGKDAKARNGEVDRRRSFGFDDDGVTVREDEAALIRDWAARLLAGDTQDSIIQELNKTVPSVRGGKWSYAGFRQIMTRPRNIGLIVHNGQVVDGVRLPGDPILDQRTHDRLVAMYAARKRGRQPSGRYVLTGIAECGRCDAGLSGKPVAGTGRRVYWCKSCQHTFVSVSHLEGWAADFTIRTLSDGEAVEALEREDAELEAGRQALLSEAAGIEGTLTEIGARLGKGAISLARHDAICRPLEKQQADLRAQLAELAALAARKPSLPPTVRTLPKRSVARIDWLIQWEEGSSADRRAMVLRALHGRRMIIGPGQDARFDPERVTVTSARLTSDPGE